jgi:hypothetical protein
VQRRAGEHDVEAGVVERQLFAFLFFTLLLSCVGRFCSLHSRLLSENNYPPSPPSCVLWAYGHRSHQWVGAASAHWRTGPPCPSEICLILVVSVPRGLFFARRAASACRPLRWMVRRRLSIMDRLASHEARRGEIRFLRHAFEP